MNDVLIKTEGSATINCEICSKECLAKNVKEELLKGEAVTNSPCNDIEDGNKIVYNDEIEFNGDETTKINNEGFLFKVEQTENNVSESGTLDCERITEPANDGLSSVGDAKAHPTFEELPYDDTYTIKKYVAGSKFESTDTPKNIDESTIEDDVGAITFNVSPIKINGNIKHAYKYLLSEADKNTETEYNGAGNDETKIVQAEISFENQDIINTADDRLQLENNKNAAFVPLEVDDSESTAVLEALEGRYPGSTDMYVFENDIKKKKYLKKSSQIKLWGQSVKNAMLMKIGKNRRNDCGLCEQEYRSWSEEELKLKRHRNKDVKYQFLGV